MSHDDLVIIVRVAGALVIGAMIGFERTFHGRPAGFRTHALVCVASALLMLVTVYQHQWMTLLTPDAVRTDPTRMAQGIMTGIGFLGAGVIFKEGLTVRGLTTAASIWITAAIGILVGIGFWFAAIVGAVATLTVPFQPADRGCIFLLMTKLLEKALEAVRQLPPDAQDEIARAMLTLARDEEPEPIDPAHIADVLESLAQARRRQFATDAEVEAAFRRFDR